MCWQAVSGIILTTVVSVCFGHPYAYPHIPAYQQQRQFYYSPLPASTGPQFPFAAPLSSNYVYFAPQSQVQPSRIVSPAPSALRYPSPTTAVSAGNGQYVVVYPGGTLPGGSVVLVGRQGEVEGASPGAGAGAEPVPATPEKVKPEKVEMMLVKPPDAEKLQEGVAVAQPQRLVVVGQPQFFGHYSALQKANPANLASATNGAVSSFLLLRNGNAQQFAEDPVVTADGPGSAALAYQRVLIVPKKQQKETSESGSVTIDAKETSSTNSTSESASSNEESEDVDAENEQGPSIAQAKPQAISLAGPGGVAAAAPVGTALVGPGGMALSAPSATAVAGPTAGAPISISPANKAAKTYFLAKQNPQYLFQYKP